MLASERLLEIREQFGARVERLVPLELDGEALRLILYWDQASRDGAVARTNAEALWLLLAFAIQRAEDWMG